MHAASLAVLAEWAGFSSTIRQSASTTAVDRPSGILPTGGTVGGIMRWFLMRSQVGPVPGVRPEGPLFADCIVLVATAGGATTGAGDERALKVRTLARARACRL